jgi:hypothetical protein
MYALLALIARFTDVGHPRAGGLPRQLMESAGRRAGTSPRQAHELRQAALAYLRVVR